MRHLTLDELKAGLPHIECSPKDGGALRLIVRRPRISAREVLDEAQLDVTEGLVGDTWNVRSSSRPTDGAPHPEMQLNIMNARVMRCSRSRTTGAERFGVDATTFVNSKEGRRQNLRGINAKVVRAGTIRVGDVATKA